MKSRIGFAVLFFAFLGIGIGSGQEQTHNGFWWVGSSDNFRLGFATGYAMAMVRVSDTEGFQCIANNNGGTIPQKYTDDLAKIIKQCTEDPKIARYDFGKITIGQLSDGVDEFYKDFRNKNIDINQAMFYVRDQLKGKSSKELEDELELWRHSSPH